MKSGRWQFSISREAAAAEVVDATRLCSLMSTHFIEVKVASADRVRAVHGPAYAQRGLRPGMHAGFAKRGFTRLGAWFTGLRVVWLEPCGRMVQAVTG